MPPIEAQNTTTETAIAVMSRDIHYMKESLTRVENLMANAASNFVNHNEFTTYQVNVEKAITEKDKDFAIYKNDQQKICNDIEIRMRGVEKSVTKTQVWGTVALIGINIIQFIIGLNR